MLILFVHGVIDAVMLSSEEPDDPKPTQEPFSRNFIVWNNNDNKEHQISMHAYSSQLEHLILS